MDTANNSAELTPAQRPWEALNVPSVRLIALLIVFVYPAFSFLKEFYVLDNDFGWHLRTGQWILEHRAFPHTDPFSWYGAGKAWSAYSWLFDITLATFYRGFGLIGVILIEILIRVAIPVLLYRLARTLTTSFWFSLVPECSLSFF